MWMYCRNVMEVHRPCFFIIVSATPCSLRAMAPPARRECTPMRSGSIPFSCRLSSVTQCLSPVRMFDGVMFLHSPSSVQKSEMRLLSVPPLWMMWCIRRAVAFTGQCRWCAAHSCVIVSPILPFFWFEIFSVHWSAVQSSVRDAVYRVSCLPSLKNPTSQTLNCLVRVAFVALLRGRVYSPTLNRKKKAIVARSAIALSLLCPFVYAVLSIVCGTSTGTASWGVAGGSSLRQPSMARWIGSV